MTYTIRAHGDWHTDEAGTVMYTFPLANEAVNHLQQMADAATDAGATVTGAGFIRYCTSQYGKQIVWRVWRENTPHTDS